MSLRQHRRPIALLCLAALALTGAAIAESTASAALSPRVAIGDVALSEGSSGTTPARVVVRLSKPVTTNTVVRYATVNGSAVGGSDYRSKSGSLRIRAGKASAPITVNILGDTSAESTETFTVRITGAGGIPISDAAGVVSIRNDEGIVGVTIGDATFWEGDAGKALGKIPVVLATPRGTDTLVGYTMTNGTARAPGDYRVRSGRVRIRAGRTTGAITPTYLGDTVVEGNEQFQIVITGTGASGIAIADRLATVTIRDDDTAPVNPTTTTTTAPVPPIPAAPTDLAVTAGPLARYLTADWSAAASSVPITAYDLEVTRGATTNVVASVTAPYSFGCGLAETTDTCVVRVRARSANGDGPWSTSVTASTWSAPAAPPNLTLLAGGGAISWEVPTSDRPVTSYQVHKRANNSSSWVHVTTTTLTHAATTCGFCSVRVSAQSEVGFGAWSTVAIAVPGPPTGLTATRDAINHELVHVVWNPPADSGSHPVTSYDVFVNEIPTATTSGLSSDTFLRSTLTWQIQVYANTVAGRSLAPATVTLAPG